MLETHLEEVMRRRGYVGEAGVQAAHDAFWAGATRTEGKYVLEFDEQVQQEQAEEADDARMPEWWDSAITKCTRTCPEKGPGRPCQLCIEAAVAGRE